MIMPARRQPAQSSMRRQKAFTLIELMIVVVIIGVMAALSTMSVGGNDMRRLKSEAKRLQGLISLAQDEAIFRQANFGFHLNNNQYSLLVYDPINYLWVTTPDEAFQPHSISAGVELEILVDGELQDLPVPENVQEAWEDDQDFDEEERLLPQILILASGELSPFEIHLRLKNDSTLALKVFSDGFSAIAVETLNENR